MGLGLHLYPFPGAPLQSLVWFAPFDAGLVCIDDVGNITSWRHENKDGDIIFLLQGQVRALEEPPLYAEISRQQEYDREDCERQSLLHFPILSGTHSACSGGRS